MNGWSLCLVQLSRRAGAHWLIYIAVVLPRTQAPESYHIMSAVHIAASVMEEIAPVNGPHGDRRAIIAAPHRYPLWTDVEVPDLKVHPTCTHLQKIRQSFEYKPSSSYTDQSSHSSVLPLCGAWKSWKTTFPAGSAMLACWCHGEISID